MATKVAKIKLKRNKDNTVAELSPQVSLSYGEPMYVEKEDCIIVGKSNAETLVNSKVIKAIDKDVADGLGVKWLEGFELNIPGIIEAGKAYKINNDGTLSEETTAAAPFGIRILPTETGAGNLINIRDGMTPSLSLCIPDNYRNNKTLCKNFQANFGTITSGEVKDGEVILFFSVKKPSAAFFINLIGG